MLGKWTATSLLIATLTIPFGCAPSGEDGQAGDEPTAANASEDPRLNGVGGRLQIAAASIDRHAKVLGLERYHRASLHGCQSVVAVIDNGMAGYQRQLGATLPKDTYYIGQQPGPLQTDNHGVHVAEVAYAFATGKPSYDERVIGPRMVLVEANGFSRFRESLSELIALKTNWSQNAPTRQQRHSSGTDCERIKNFIIVYSQVWEMGGNGDGQGFVNREVDRAIDAGFLWLNAVGNYRDAVYRSKLEKGRAYEIPISVTRAGPVRTVLAWNDFRNSTDYASQVDLDLEIQDISGRTIGASARRQAGALSRGIDRRATFGHAFEILPALPLEVGEYKAVVHQVSEDVPSAAHFWLTAYGLGTTLPQHSTDNSVLIPNDNPRVIPVGALDTKESSAQFGRDGSLLRPDLITPSRILFVSPEDATRRLEVDGTSLAAPMSAAAVAVFGDSQTAPLTADRIRALGRDRRLSGSRLLRLP